MSARPWLKWLDRRGAAWVKGESRQEGVDHWGDGEAQTAGGREDLGSTSHAPTPSDIGRSRERLKLPVAPRLWAAGMGERWKGEGQGHHKVSNGLSQS